MNFRKISRYIHPMFSGIKLVAAAFAAALLINHTLIVNAVVPSESMESTISPGDRIIGNRLAYIFSEPERGDVILFAFPNNESKQYVKRIIGLPGETVRIDDGTIYINDVPLDEPYLNETPVGNFGSFDVPEESYFVLGDNRNDSFDSRFWNDPYVHADQIYAKVGFCYYPHPYFLNRD